MNNIFMKWLGSGLKILPKKKKSLMLDNYNADTDIPILKEIERIFLPANTIAKLEA